MARGPARPSRLPGRPARWPRRCWARRRARRRTPRGCSLPRIRFGGARTRGAPRHLDRLRATHEVQPLRPIRGQVPLPLPQRARRRRHRQHRSRCTRAALLSASSASIPAAGRRTRRHSMPGYLRRLSRSGASVPWSTSARGGRTSAACSAGPRGRPPPRSKPVRPTGRRCQTSSRSTSPCMAPSCRSSGTASSAGRAAATSTACCCGGTCALSGRALPLSTGTPRPSSSRTRSGPRTWRRSGQRCRLGNALGRRCGRRALTSPSG